jgi:hypothetical protein
MNKSPPNITAESKDQSELGIDDILPRHNAKIEQFYFKYLLNITTQQNNPRAKINPRPWNWEKSHEIG